MGVILLLNSPLELDQEIYTSISMKDVTFPCRTPVQKQHVRAHSEKYSDYSWLTFKQQNLTNHYSCHEHAVTHLNTVYLFQAWQLYTAGNDLTA